MAQTISPTWTIADRLRKARNHAGLSREEMAERVGVSERTVQNYESDEWHRRRPVLRLWAEASGVPLEWITDGDEGGSTHSTWTPLTPGQQSFPFVIAA